MGIMPEGRDGAVVLNSPAVVRPGDTLIVTFADRLSAQEFDQVCSDLRAALGEAVGVAIIEGATGCVVYRPNPEAT